MRIPCEIEFEKHEKREKEEKRERERKHKCEEEEEERERKRKHECEEEEHERKRKHECEEEEEHERKRKHECEEEEEHERKRKHECEEEEHERKRKHERKCREKECEVFICMEDHSKCVVGAVLNDIRSDIIGELGAINQYSQHFVKWREKCPEAAKLFCDTMNDEKKHVAEFIRLLVKLDPTQAKFFREVGCPFKD